MLKKLFLASTLFLFLGAAASHADISAELLNNSDFTKPLSSSPGWDLYGDHNQQSVMRNEMQNGQSTLHIIDKDNAGEIGITQIVPGQAGLVYQAEAHIRPTEKFSTIGAFLQLRFLPSNRYEQVGLEDAEPATAQHPWQQVTVRSTAPEGTKQVQVYLYTHASREPDFYVYGVSLKSGFVPSFPAPVAPQYTALKDLHLQTSLVQNGKAVSAIVAPASGQYKQEAQALQKALSAKTGASVPIISDDDAAADVPLTQNVILLGNRSTNKTLSKMYDRFYALTDLKYPGVGGYEVRSVHNPFGNGYNAIILGGSDDAGVQTATQHFIRVLPSQATLAKSLAVGWLLDVKTGQKVQLPPDGAGRMPTWRDSREYTSRGYFGWNSVSKNEALYYETGDPQYAREFLRLAFPDAQAKKDIDRIDGERIENKNDPLGGAYHYNATRMILFWNLIEASPVFTDAERLKVTNALARELNHIASGPDSSWTGNAIYHLIRPAQKILTRHENLAAMTMYTFSRYFENYYPSPVWEQAFKASGEYYFAPLKQAEPWVNTENDDMFWYNTTIAPILDYMIISGDHSGVKSGALNYLLTNQQVILDGTTTDEQLVTASALDYLNKAAYLTNDGRWITYRERLKLDTDEFRLGQSFWPPPSLKPAQPTDLLNKWTGWFLTPAQIDERGTNFTPQQSFQALSYRTAPDDTGDFILLDGMNGESRNPYHTFALLNLRVAGKQLLKGYLNQVRTTADGTVEPRVAKDAALRKHFTIGQSTFASADVPNLPYCNWQRGVYLRAGKYGLTIDKLKFRTNSQHFETEFMWQNDGRDNLWKDEDGKLISGATHLVTADSLPTTLIGYGIQQFWDGAVKQGEEKDFFSLIAPDAPGQKISGMRVAPNAAVFAAPETILVSTDDYKNVNASIALRSATYFFAENLQSAPGITTSSPIDIDWDNATGVLNVNATQETRLTLDLPQATGVTYDGKKMQAGNHQVSITPGKHVFTGAFMADALKSTFMGAGELLAKTPQPAAQKPASDVPDNLPELTPAFKISVPESIVQTIAVHDDSPARYYAAAGKVVYALDAAGKTLRQFDAPTDVTKIHWWPQAKLLLVGTKDQKVLAFTTDGTLKWTFQSELAPEVYAAGKSYWFPSAPGHGGIHGLDSGVFINNQSQLFVGSASTLEILDENGKLIKRLPQFWGPPALFQLIPAGDGSVNLLAARDITDTPAPHVINSKTLDPTPLGFNSVPSGFDSIGGWADQRVQHIYYADLDGDGKKEVITDIVGAWNRITTYDENGNAKSSIYFGAGPSAWEDSTNIPASVLIRGLDVGDIDGDGKPEIVTALSKGLILVLDGQCHLKWSRRVSGVPSALKIVGQTIVIGQEDGTLLTLDGKGNFQSKSQTNGAINSLVPSAGQSVIAVDDKAIEEFKVP